MERTQPKPAAFGDIQFLVPFAIAKGRARLALQKALCLSCGRSRRQRVCIGCSRVCVCVCVCVCVAPLWVITLLNSQ